MSRHKLLANALALAWLAGAAAGSKAADVKSSTAPPAAQVEVQVSLCSPQEQVVRALDLRARGGVTEVWLFDDESLTLFGKGLRFRLRTAKDATDLTVKVANQDCAKFAASQAPSRAAKCEFDLHDTTVAGAVSLGHDLGATAAARLIAGELPLPEALSTTQTGYLRDLPGAWPLPKGVRSFGPQRVMRYRGRNVPYDVDVATLPGGETYIEISRKVKIADAVRVREQLDADMSRAGVSVCADQSAQAINKLRAMQRQR